LRWNNTRPTDTVFSIGTHNSVNGSGDTYVAYLFASDAGGFGDDGDESIIKCGSYTGNGTYTQFQDLGWEPQWILFKNASASDDWWIYDSMRGLVVGGPDNRLAPNLSSAEAVTGSSAMSISATGFTPNAYSTSGQTYIYIAIRRPMKTPESGTEVFAVQKGQNAASGSTPSFISGFPVDLAITNATGGASSNSAAATRLTGTGYLSTSSTIAESTNSTYAFDYMTGWRDSIAYADIVSWMFKRATGFFDVVATTGASGVLTLNHNLGVPPEFLISKRRDGTSHWYADQVVNYLRLNTDGGNLGTPVFNNFTATTFNADAGTFSSGETYITYLFATLAGVSKVGSYTGTGSNVDVDCGFSAGARFILIKRTDSTGDWYVYDSERGIVAGNDPYILLNSTAAEVTNTDYIDPLSSGFTVTSSAPAALNASGGSYIFLAIA